MKKPAEEQIGGRSYRISQPLTHRPLNTGLDPSARFQKGLVTLTGFFIFLNVLWICNHSH